MINNNPNLELDELLAKTVESLGVLSISSNNKYCDLTNNINQQILHALDSIADPKHKVLLIIKESGIAFSESEQEEIINNIKHKKEFTHPELETRVINIISPRRAELEEANSKARRAIEEVQRAMHILEIEDALSRVENPRSSSSKVACKESPAEREETPATSAGKSSDESRIMARYAVVMENLDGAVYKFEKNDLKREKEISKIKALRSTAMDLLDFITGK